MEKYSVEDLKLVLDKDIDSCGAYRGVVYEISPGRYLVYLYVSMPSSKYFRTFVDIMEVYAESPQDALNDAIQKREEELRCSSRKR